MIPTLADCGYDTAWGPDSLAKLTARLRAPLVHSVTPVTIAADRAAMARRMIPVATDLALLVRERDTTGIARLAARVKPSQRTALLVVLAAMVDITEPLGDLLAWVDAVPAPLPELGGLWQSFQPRQLSPCGTEAAYKRHRRHGEKPCGPCQKARTGAEQQRRTRASEQERSAA